jgi:hypothetical protein
VGNSRGARKLARTPHVNQKKKKKKERKKENSLMPQKNCNRKVIGAKWFIDGFLAESLLVLSSSS